MQDFLILDTYEFCISGRRVDVIIEIRCVTLCSGCSIAHLPIQQVVPPNGEEVCHVLQDRSHRHTEILQCEKGRPDHPHKDDIDWEPNLRNFEGPAGMAFNMQVI